GDHADLGARMGQGGVRRDGRAVHELVDLRERDTRLLGELREAVDDGLGRVARSGRDLLDDGGAALVIEEVEICERSADIDADALHGGILPREICGKHSTNVTCAIVRVAWVAPYM